MVREILFAVTPGMSLLKSFQNHLTWSARKEWDLGTLFFFFQNFMAQFFDPLNFIRNASIKSILADFQFTTSRNIGANISKFCVLSSNYLPNNQKYSVNAKQLKLYGIKGKCILTQLLPCHKQDMTQGQFLNAVKLVWIQSFPSPKPVALPRLKNPVYPTTYL